MNKPFIVIGAGSHARVVVDLLLSMKAQVIGLCDVDPILKGQKILGVPVLGKDDILDNYAPDSICLAMGIGATGKKLSAALKLRMGIYEELLAKGYKFPDLVHPTATIGRECLIQAGSQVMAGSVVQSGCRIGALSIVNTKASLDHECSVGKGVHIGPGVTIGGNVDIGDFSYIGLGASIIQSIQIGEETTVGAGSVVINDVKSTFTVMGVPARIITEK